MRVGDVVLCIKDYLNFEQDEEYFISSVWDDGGCTIKIQLEYNGRTTNHAYISFSKDKLEEYFTNLEIERRLKLRKINSYV
jgi:hypothetical protein